MAENRAIPVPFTASVTSESAAFRRAAMVGGFAGRGTFRMAFANGAAPVAKGSSDIKAGISIRC